MIEIHVEPHSDSVRGHEIIDLASLKHADLRVARAGAQRPENDRSASTLAADNLSERKYVRYCECNNSAARRQPRHFFVPGIGKHRKARAAHMFYVADESPH